MNFLADPLTPRAHYFVCIIFVFRPAIVLVLSCSGIGSFISSRNSKGCGSSVLVVVAVTLEAVGEDVRLFAPTIGSRCSSSTSGAVGVATMRLAPTIG